MSPTKADSSYSPHRLLKTGVKVPRLFKPTTVQAHDCSSRRLFKPVATAAFYTCFLHFATNIGTLAIPKSPRSWFVVAAPKVHVTNKWLSRQQFVELSVNENTLPSARFTRDYKLYRVYFRRVIRWIFVISNSQCACALWL